MALALECAEDAERIDHALSVCYGLAIGCIPIAIAAGERDTAASWIAALKRRTTRHALRHWHGFVEGYGQALDPALPDPRSVSGMQAEMFAVARGEGTAVRWSSYAA
jgi:hypothetical protein